MSELNDFERALESELHRIFDPMTGRTSPSSESHRSLWKQHQETVGGACAAVGVKIVTKPTSDSEPTDSPVVVHVPIPLQQ